VLSLIALFFLVIVLGAPKISVNVSRLLLANKIDPFEELLITWKEFPGYFVFHPPLLGLVSAQYFVLFFLWFPGKGIR